MVDPRDFGAVGDGRTLDTDAIQAAIDAATGSTGVVHLAHGVFRCGTIDLASGTTLSIARNATLLASTDHRDFDAIEDLPYVPWADQETHSFRHALVAAEGASHIAVVGGGVIADERHHRFGPKPIAFRNCRHITVRDVTITGAPNYAISLLGCDDVVVDGVTIHDAFADGIDPDCCRFVRISNCDVDAWDDAICIKTSLSFGERRPTEHVTVTNCTLRSSCSNIKIGTETSGDVRDIAVTNCTMAGRPGDPPADENSGIAIESVDGAIVEGVVVDNIVMHGVATPIFVRLGNRGRGLDVAVPGAISGVRVSNMFAFGAHQTSSITGIPGHPVRDISLRDISVRSIARDTTPSDPVPEAEPDYPRATMFGVLPAFGLFVRHVDSLTLRDVHWFDDTGEDPRPPVMFDRD